MNTEQKNLHDAVASLRADEGWDEPTTERCTFLLAAWMLDSEAAADIAELSLLPVDVCERLATKARGTGIFGAERDYVGEHGAITLMLDEQVLDGMMEAVHAPGAEPQYRLTQKGRHYVESKLLPEIGIN